MKRLIVLFCLALIYSSCKTHFFKAASGSMEETIQVGETVRVTLTNEFERNDIVVFDYYGPDYSSSWDPRSGEIKQAWSKRIYRLIGLSGDSVQINKGEVFVNGRHASLPMTGKLLYRVNAKGTIDELGDIPGSGITKTTPDTVQYAVQLTRPRAEELASRKPFVMSVTRILSAERPVPDTLYARPAGSGEWTLDYYGPFKIPSPGDTIIANEVNWKFYHNIPGITQGMNVIKEKLYFVLGDNRYGAEDSRFIGLIAHSKMYGVVK